MNESDDHSQTVLLRSSRWLANKDELTSLITTEIKVELPDSSVGIRIYAMDHPRREKKLVICEAEKAFPLTVDVSSILHEIADASLPVPGREDSELKATGSMPPIEQKAMKEMPKYFQRFCLEADDQLSAAILSFVNLLRWRTGALVGLDLSECRGEFSLNKGQSWHGLPDCVEWVLVPEETPPQSRSPVNSEEVGELIAVNAESPLSRDLFCDAWALLETSPRASLVIGYTALEVGCKELIGRLVPDAKWLAIEAPSPPIDQILQKYVPKIPKRLCFKDHAEVPRPLIKQVRELRDARNALAHRGEFRWNSLKVREVLLAINDLLLMFDVYAGHKWASELISLETKRMLTKQQP